MKDPTQVMGRLRLLSQLAHWLSSCKNWPLVRGLYEAIIESVGLGECTWATNFDHYESRIPAGVPDQREPAAP